jgi:hypothetical protein
VTGTCERCGSALPRDCKRFCSRACYSGRTTPLGRSVRAILERLRAADGWLTIVELAQGLYGLGERSERNATRNALWRLRRLHGIEIETDHGDRGTTRRYRLAREAGKGAA